ncbi:hypothetical protein P879_09876 [Paragonimus westermani]|uniref:TLC domain-containing protein n=1 Tax=Paragonimus westermani TaxID=34504 RepID=A0A8T0D0I0_9TREM|nr:hypothetical protein P879_09876 [Paragonimus westermani]
MTWWSAVPNRGSANDKLKMLPAWAKRCGVQSADTAKVSESVWKGTMHGLLWLSSLYVVILSGKHSFFHRPCQVWDGIVWNKNLYVDPPAFDLQVIYALQLAHYLHTAYATLFVDTWRSDWIALIVHHVVTLSLISLSFIRRFLPMGALVLFIHDISDVLLEFTKLNVYFKWRHGKPSMINKYLSDIGFLLFALSWLPGPDAEPPIGLTALNAPKRRHQRHYLRKALYGTCFSELPLLHGGGPVLPDTSNLKSL